jgi:hypothetical protein
MHHSLDKFSFAWPFIIRELIYSVFQLSKVLHTLEKGYIDE